MDVNVQLHAPAALLARKASLLPTEYEDVWASGHCPESNRDSLHVRVVP
jgi:hypothetical protein